MFHGNNNLNINLNFVHDAKSVCVVLLLHVPSQLVSRQQVADLL